MWTCEARSSLRSVLQLFRHEAGMQSRNDNVPSMLDWQCFVCSVYGCVTVCLNCVCPATEPGEGGLSFRLCGMSSNLWVGRVVEWMQWPAAFPFPMFLLKQGSPSLQIYKDTWICSFPISLFLQ